MLSDHTQKGYGASVALEICGQLQLFRTYPCYTLRAVGLLCMTHLNPRKATS